MYDLIGDIHGHAHELHWLLEKLGYDRRRGFYSHPQRRVIFVGDLIDRGPHIADVLRTVKPMVEHGAALCVMGNHEFNAIAYHTRSPSEPDRFLRPHIDKNILQHNATLRQLTSTELYEVVDWFKRLPVAFDEDGVRVVHACWDDAALAEIQSALDNYGGWNTGALEEATQKDTELFDAVETVLKGREIPLPAGKTFRDKDGVERRRIRTRWYLHPEGLSFAEFGLPQPEDPELHSEPVPPDYVSRAVPYPETDPPVFCGHYWLADTEPTLLAPNVACLDFSIAKGGLLCAYRWDGEHELLPAKFVTVNSLQR